MIENIPDGIQEASAHVFVAEIDTAVALLWVIVVVQALAVLRIPLGSILQAEDLSESASNGCALESNLGVVHPVDITHQHVHAAVVAAIRHGQHVIKGASARQQGHQPPKSSTPEVCTPDTLELPGAGHLDHGDAGAYIDQEIRVDVWSSLGKLHRLGIGIAVGEHFIGDFGDKKVQAWQGEWLGGASRHPIPVSLGPTDD